MTLDFDLLFRNFVFMHKLIRVCIDASKVNTRTRSVTEFNQHELLGNVYDSMQFKISCNELSILKIVDV